MTEPINIPIEMEVRAKATLNLTNTKTGEVQTMSMGAPEGMILDHYLDWAMQRGLGLLGETTFNRCYLGTGDTPVQPTDTGLSGSQLAVSSSSTLTKDLTPVNQKLEVLGTVEGLDIGAPGCLAVTSDEEILLVGRDDDLRAFYINKNNWTLTPIQVDDFAGLSGIQALCIKNDLLFVGIGQAPWGKLYKRVGDDFEFFADVPGLSARPTRADISLDDEYLLLRSPLRVFSIGDGILTEIDSSAVDSTHQRYVFAGNGHDVFSGNYTSGSSFNVHRYSIVDDALVFQESFVLPIALPSYTTLRSLIDLAAVGDTIHAYGQIYYSSTGYGYGTGLSSLFMTNGVWKVAKERSFAIRYTSNSSHISGAAIINPSLFFTLGDFGVGIMSPGIRYPHTDLIGIDTTDNSSWVWLDAEQVLLIRDVSGSPSNLKIIKIRESDTSLQSYARKWTFPAGTGTGVVNEVVVRATSGTGYDGNNRYFLRFVLPEGFEKTDLHQLEVEVEAEIENPGVWEGVIPEGSRDGSDVSYRITMSENQFVDFITTGYNN
ncbi:MAG: hypothetical protein GX303_09330, partial [Clostridiales bacterium]|nr:hypothetical protein [Clostridiales bacterium]